MSEETVVVGAGAAGLAVAATLGERGVPYRVLERADTVGAAWAARYDSLRLHTARWLSGLPGAGIPRKYGAWVSRDDLVTYLQDYADRFGVQPELGVDVSRVDRDGDEWVLTTSSGEYRAGEVVIATGYTRVPDLPDWHGADTFPGPISHSTAYRNPGPYYGRSVLVVGAGNSAADIAVDLAGTGAEVYLAVRTPPNIVRRDTLGVPSQLIGIATRRVPDRVMNPLGSTLRRLSVPDLSEHGLPAPPGDGFTQFRRTKTVPILDHGFVAQVRSGRIKVVAPIGHFEGAVVHLTDGTTLQPEAVVAATGFRPGLEPMVGHLGVLDQDGVPVAHGAETLPHAPGLRFVGIEVILAGLLREIGIEAKAVANAIADEARAA